MSCACRDRFEFDRETPSGGGGSLLSGSVAYDVSKFARLRADLEAPYMQHSGGPRPGGQQLSRAAGQLTGAQKRAYETHSDGTQQQANGGGDGHPFQKSRVQTLRADAYSEPTTGASPSLSSSDVTISVASLQHTYSSGETDVTVSNLLSLQVQFIFILLIY